MQWRIQPRHGVLSTLPTHRAHRHSFLTSSSQPEDSFRSFIEQILEDVLVGGFAPSTRSQRRSRASLVMCRLTAPAFAFAPTGTASHVAALRPGHAAFLPDQDISLTDEELSYIRLNRAPHPSASANLRSPSRPFTSSSAPIASPPLAATARAIRPLAAGLSPQHHERLIRWWQDEIEGTGKVPSSPSRPSPKCCASAAAPMPTSAAMAGGPHPHHCRRLRSAAYASGLERDVNRNTASTQSDDAFRTAVVPVARLVAEHLTRDAISKRLGWDDLEFVFTDVDALTNWNRRKSSKSSSAAACLP